VLDRARHFRQRTAAVPLPNTPPPADYPQQPPQFPQPAPKKRSKFRAFALISFLAVVVLCGIGTIVAVASSGASKSRPRQPPRPRTRRPLP
jgi:hypothetical protein